MELLDDTTATVNEDYLVADPADVWDKALQFRDGLLALSYASQYRTDLLKGSYKILERF